MSKAGYILQVRYASGTLRGTPQDQPDRRSGTTPRTRSGCPVSIDQIFSAPFIGLAVPAQMPMRVRFVCVSPEEIPVLERVENVTTSENRMYDELSAVRQSINPALS